MKLLSIGDEVGHGTYERHASFRRAASFRQGDSLVFLVSEEIGPGPLNLVVGDCGFEITQTVPSITIDNDILTLGRYQLRFAETDRYRSGLALGAFQNDSFARNVSQFREFIMELAHPKSLAFLLDRARLNHFETGFERAFARQVTSGVAQFFRGALEEGIAALKGCGVGLTPSGDDFIAGILIGLNLLQKQQGRDFRPTLDNICEAAKGSNLLSNTFLEMAKRGRGFEAMKNLITSLHQDSEAAVQTCTRKLLTFGGTSGSDLATGFLMTLEDDTDVIARLNAPWVSQDTTHALEVGVE